MRALRSLDQWDLLPYIGKWLMLACAVAVLAGTASAWFLLSLDWATRTREATPWIIVLLPVAGFTVGWAYDSLGKPVEAGNNLIIDEIHDPRKVIPRRMVPLVFIGTVVSHLFGASVGREGTAVQMGGALADQVTAVRRLRPEDRRVLLMAGMSAGFAAVFGTPLAGALFGLEVLAIGRMRYDALFPCVIAAIAADRVCLAWGVHHTAYAVGTVVPLTVWTLISVIVAGIIFICRSPCWRDSASSPSSPGLPTPRWPRRSWRSNCSVRRSLPSPLSHAWPAIFFGSHGDLPRPAAGARQARASFAGGLASGRTACLSAAPARHAVDRVNPIMSGVPITKAPFSIDAVIDEKLQDGGETGQHAAAQRLPAGHHVRSSCGQKMV